jgi:hypothetical protein
LRFTERGFYGTSALLNNKAASCRRTPKKVLSRYNREMVFVEKVLGLIFDPVGIECE